MSVLDYLSRADVYASLHQRLVQGYGLDALAEEEDSRKVEAEDSTARGFALLAQDSEIADRKPGTGLGEEVRFAANGVSGSGLVHDGELIQLSVFPDEDGNRGHSHAVPGGRVRRPSRRRNR